MSKVSSFRKWENHLHVLQQRWNKVPIHLDSCEIVYTMLPGGQRFAGSHHHKRFLPFYEVSLLLQGLASDNTLGFICYCKIL